MSVSTKYTLNLPFPLDNYSYDHIFRNNHISRQFLQLPNWSFTFTPPCFIFFITTRLVFFSNISKTISFPSLKAVSDPPTHFRRKLKLLFLVHLALLAWSLSFFYLMVVSPSSGHVLYDFRDFAFSRCFAWILVPSCHTSFLQGWLFLIFQVSSKPTTTSSQLVHLNT